MMTQLDIDRQIVRQADLLSSVVKRYVQVDCGYSRCHVTHGRESIRLLERRTFQIGGKFRRVKLVTSM